MLDGSNKAVWCEKMLFESSGYGKILGDSFNYYLQTFGRLWENPEKWFDNF
jgi:hypothetical protein